VGEVWRNIVIYTIPPSFRYLLYRCNGPFILPLTIHSTAVIDDALVLKSGLGLMNNRVHLLCSRLFI